MKKTVAILILLLSVQSFSQNLECCNSIESVKKAIEGEWKLKGQSENLIYKFWFNEQNGFIEVLEELNLPPKAEHTQLGSLFMDEQVQTQIKLINGAFFIEVNYPFDAVSELISKLNQNTFIYGKGASQHVFIKDAN